MGLAGLRDGVVHKRSAHPSRVDERMQCNGSLDLMSFAGFSCRTIGEWVARRIRVSEGKHMMMVAPTGRAPAASVREGYQKGLIRGKGLRMPI